MSLKQLRDAGTADVACYQKLVEGTVELENLQWRAAAGTWVVEIDVLESHPIGEDLSVATSTSLHLNSHSAGPQSSSASCQVK